MSLRADREVCFWHKADMLNALTKSQGRAMSVELSVERAFPHEPLYISHIMAEKVGFEPPRCG